MLLAPAEPPAAQFNRSLLSKARSREEAMCGGGDGSGDGFGDTPPREVRRESSAGAAEQHDFSFSIDDDSLRDILGDDGDEDDEDEPAASRGAAAPLPPPPPAPVLGSLAATVATVASVRSLRQTQSMVPSQAPRRGLGASDRQPSGDDLVSDELAALFSRRKNGESITPAKAPAWRRK